MVLPGGVTGVWRRGDEPPTVTDVRVFRGHCYEAARRAGGRVVAITNPNAGDVCRNFAVAVLELAGGELAIVLNALHPIVAFADPPAEGELRLRFRESPELAEAFASFGVYRLASVAELEEPLTLDAIRELSEAEREQVAYWKPRRLGDVVFNWWD